MRKRDMPSRLGRVNADVTSKSVTPHKEGMSERNLVSHRAWEVGKITTRDANGRKKG